MMPQAAGGPPKPRPAIFLASLPGPYQTALLCGISTQLHLIVVDWDELIGPADADFASSGLHHPSAIRLSFLHGAHATDIGGVIGQIDDSRLDRLRQRLSDHLVP